MDQQPFYSTISRSANGRIDHQKATCPRLHQTCTATDDPMGKLQICTLHIRCNDMARRGKSINPIPHIKTCSKMIWAIPHQESSIRCHVQTRTPITMEDPPHVSCQPPNSI